MVLDSDIVAHSSVKDVVQAEVVPLYLYLQVSGNTHITAFNLKGEGAGEIIGTWGLSSLCHRVMAALAVPLRSLTKTKTSNMKTGLQGRLCHRRRALK